MARRRWYLLIHQLPPKPIYLRAKIGQRLTRAGAVALKNSVYLLPRRERCLKELQAIAVEASAGGGEAWVSEARLIGGVADSELVNRFHIERGNEYDALAQEIRAALGRLKSRGRTRPPEEELARSLPRLREKFAEIRAVDFFGAPARRRTQRLLRSLENRLKAVAKRKADEGGRNRDLVGRTWVTRRGLHIDRIASAWLVRRFIDPNARFRFVDPKEAEKRPGEIRFDIPGGDFTHEEDRCTFEAILRRVGAPDPSLRPIAEIVHDIDLKDGKFGRAEAPGVERLLLGILLAHPDDEERLERGFALFDDLRVSFRKRPRSVAV
jgi:hypothetical protein